MFGLGFWEIVGIVVVGLILIKPREIPKLISKIGNAYGKMTHQYRSMVRMIRETESEIKYKDENDEKENEDISLPFTGDSDRTDKKPKKPL